VIRSILYNPAIDVNYSIPRFGEQTTFTGLKSESYPAGKAINFAKAVKALGEEVELYGIVPARDISKFRDYLEECGISHDLMEISGNTRINTTIFEEKSGIPYHLNSDSEQVLQSEMTSFNDMLSSKMQENDFWAFSGSIPAGCDEEIYKKLIEECKSKNIKTALDTRSNPLKYGISAVPFLVSPNEFEFQELYSEEIKGLQHIALRAKRLIDSGIEYVFVTLGKDGVVALHGGECLLCAPPEVKNQINAVGCGDSFLAGVVYGFQKGFEFSEVCRMAVACGAANTQTREPGKIDLKNVHYFMERVRVESV
jgi:1-phosphofructokinase family hexose kinase